MEDKLSRSGTVLANGVRLSVPASFEHVRVARLTAAAVAERLAFGVDDIDDVRVAVDELSSALIEAGPVSDIAFEFADRRDVFVAEATATVAARPHLNELARHVLGVVVDGFELSETGGHAYFRATKRPPASD
jgi:serine/threonine-protein kinase RsbW